MRRADTSDGLSVAYVDFEADMGDDSDRERPPLLFAHATGFHSMVWRPVAERLSARFHCYAFDERGHGDTPAPPDGDFAWRGFAKDALAVTNAVDAGRKWFGVGHSAGGAALLLAELERPGSFEAVYVYEPIVPPVEESPAGGQHPNLLAESARRRREVFPSRDAAYENYAAKPPLGVFDAAALRAYVEHGFEELDDGTVRLKCRGEQEARTYESAHRHHLFLLLGDVKCPVTVAYGEQTETFGPDFFRLVAERLPNARVQEVAGLGHFGPMQDPAAVAASIRRSFD